MIKEITGLNFIAPLPQVDRHETSIRGLVGMLKYAVDYMCFGCVSNQTNCAKCSHIQYINETIDKYEVK